MDRSILRSFSFGATCICAMAGSASAEFVSGVQSFTQGTIGFADGVSTYSNSSTATGQPNRIAGASIGFPGAVTPFNPPYEQSELVAVGVGGQLTVELASLLPVNSAGQIGIFHSAGLNDPTFSGQAEATARTFAGAEYAADRTALVEVADTLGNFKSLGRVAFTQPTQGFANQTDPYAFPDPATPSDFNKPFIGSLASYDGLNQSQISAMQNGSAGGTWLQISPAIAAELTGVRYVRISDPKWQDIATGAFSYTRPSNYDPDGAGPLLPFVKAADLLIDGINVVPEPTMLGLIGLGMIAIRRRRQSL